MRIGTNTVTAPSGPAGTSPLSIAYGIEVSDETIRAYTNPVCVIGLRETGQLLGRNQLNALSENIFVFTLNPKGVRFERRARVAVQDAQWGYLVTDNGLTAPRFSLRGNFGWGFKAALLSPPAQDALIGQSSQALAMLTGVSPLAAPNSLRLDGRQAWRALEAICQKYFEDNARRLAKGVVLLEMVWFDQLHGKRWVVKPSALPTLDHQLETQGLHPYTLDLIGVYDDLRPKPKTGRDLWSTIQ